MKHFLFTTAVCSLIATPLWAATNVIPVSQQKSLSIAIYNGDIALVNDVRTGDLKAGLNQISFEEIATQIIPESALLSGNGIQTLEQNFDYDVISTASLLKKSIGQAVILQTENPETGEKTQTEGKLLAYDSNNNDSVLEINGQIVPNPKGNIILSKMPDGLIPRPSLRLSVRSQNAGTQPLSLNYLTNGLSWEADYVANLNEKETDMDLNGFITLNNQSSSVFKEADVRLVSGDVSVVRHVVAPRMYLKGVVNEDATLYAAADGAMPEVENVSDFYVYSLPFKTTISPKQTKQVALLSKNQVPLHKEYVFDNTLNPATHPIENRKAVIYYTFDNTKENKLGEALPKGTIRFYKEMKNGESIFVGEAQLGHTPNQAHVRLRMSDSFDVFANAKRTQYEKLGKNASLSEYEITLKNGSNELKTATVYKNLYGTWKITKSDHDYTKETANRIFWKIDIPANGEVTLKYTVQITDNE